MRIQWNDLVCGYPGREPLNLPFSGQVEDPGVYGILGPNGAGKSTLMRTWLGLTQPLSGSVRIDHACCGHGQGRTPCLGYVPQFHRVNSYFPIQVRALVRQGFGPKASAHQVAGRVEKVLLDLEILSLAESSFHELSLGQKTRVLVARALVSEPRLLFLDEPFASLDTDCQAFLVSHLRRLAEVEGVSAFVIDHHLGQHEDLLDGEFVFERRHYDNTCRVEFRSRRRRLGDDLGGTKSAEAPRG